MSKKPLTFDPAKQKLVATRDFTRGQLAGTKGKEVDTSGLDDRAIEQLVTRAGVAKVEARSKGGRKPAAKKPAAAEAGAKDGSGDAKGE